MKLALPLTLAIIFFYCLPTHTKSVSFEQKAQVLVTSLAIPETYSWNCLAIRSADLLSKSADQRYTNLAQALYVAALYTNTGDIIEALRPHAVALTMLANHSIDDDFIRQAHDLIAQLVTTRSTTCPLILFDATATDPVPSYAQGAVFGGIVGSLGLLGICVCLMGDPRVRYY